MGRDCLRSRGLPAFPLNAADLRLEDSAFLSVFLEDELGCGVFNPEGVRCPENGVVALSDQSDQPHAPLNEALFTWRLICEYFWGDLALPELPIAQ